MKLSLFSVLIQIAFYSSAESTCSDGWAAMGEQACIKLEYPMEASWFHLQTICDAQDGFLPELTSTTQVELFKNIIQSYQVIYGEALVLLGGTDLTNEMIWRWVHHQTDIDLDNWTEGFPDETQHNNKDCLAAFTDDGLWVDVSCEETFKVAVICMRNPIGTTPQPSTTAETTATPSCKEGWSKFQNSCYQFQETLTSWTEANYSCSQMNSHLATIQSDAENVWVSEMILTSHVFPLGWIGGYRDAGDTTLTWKWVDGSEWTYSDWKSGEPNNGNGNGYLSSYRGVSTGPGWIDISDSSDYGYESICEYEL